MKTYLVGGAVRDQLLGRPITERDWLVTGVTSDQLRATGYRKVGKDFPVFLHPQTHEEYALPRRRRISKGGTGSVESGVKAKGKDVSHDSVSIEEDLARRDLTINAMALGADGEIIDPCGGQADLDNRILRHTPAFSEDPLRILRLARFAARYYQLGFVIAPETEQLVREMAATEVLDNLVSERIWMEFSKAMSEDNAHIFIKVLHEMGILVKIIPELDRLFGVPQPAKYHPEIDTGLHTLLVLEQACRLSRDPQIRFAALTHDLGKGGTPFERLPSHHGHEERGAKLIKPISKRLRIPNTWRDLAMLSARYHTHCHRALELRPKTLLKTLLALDAFRKPQRFEKFLLVCEADVRGRTGMEEQSYPQASYFRTVWQAASGVDAAAISRLESNLQQIPKKIRQARKRAIALVKEAWVTE